MAIDPALGHLPPPLFRNAHVYASEVVAALLHDVVQAPELALLVDVDTLERSALARVDRVMQLALAALARADVHIVFVARYEAERARILHCGIAGSSTFSKDEADVLACVRRRGAGVRVITISDDPDLIRALTANDRGLALGRPELAGANVAVTGEHTVRATLWWLLEARAKASSSYA